MLTEEYDVPPNILDEPQAKVALPLLLIFARGVTLLTVGSIQRLGGTAIRATKRSAIAFLSLISLLPVPLPRRPSLRLCRI
jgi:hypothetical protein